MTAANRVVRQSPSGRKLGALGFAHLSLSAPVAYTDGVPLQIPFDTIDDMSEGFGSLVVGGPATAPGSFRLTDKGVYLVQLTFTYSAAGTANQMEVLFGSDLAGFGSEPTDAVMSVSGNALITSLAGIAADISSIFLCTGASGNLLTATCLILQVG